MESLNDRRYEFERFAAEHRRIIAKVCWMYAGDDAGWQDLCQEVLINLWRGFDTFERQSKASTWVWRVALNTCISCQRRDRRHDQRAPGPQQRRHAGQQHRAPDQEERYVIPPAQSGLASLANWAI